MDVLYPEARRRATQDTVRAWELDAVQWDALQRDYRVGELELLGCACDAIPKTSANGVRFFALASGSCGAAPETQWHLAAKALVHGTFERLGVDFTSTEERAVHDGKCWQADVFAVQGDRTIAVEIQHSYQHLRRYLARQTRYEDAGVHCVWLLPEARFKALMRSCSKLRLQRDFGGTVPSAGYFPCLPELPMAYLALDAAPSVRGARLDVSIETFLTALLEDRFRWRDGAWVVE